MLPRLLYAAILYYVNLVFIITTSVLLSLHYLLSLPMVLSSLLMHNCIYMTMPTFIAAMNMIPYRQCKQHIAGYRQAK